MAKILHRKDGQYGCGEYKILTPNLAEQLLIIEEAGRTCYRSADNPITAKSASRFIRMIIKRGHESVIEHSSLTVKFSNVSRGFTHEMVRHRLCAFSQESTRYVDYVGEKLDTEKAEATFVMPPHRENEEIVVGKHSKCTLKISEIFEDLEHWYRCLRKAGWPPQDARQVLPIGTAAQIVVTANLREWRHIMTMRTQKAAHWEIRSVICRLLHELKTIIPVVFEDLTRAGCDKNGVEFFVRAD